MHIAYDPVVNTAYLYLQPSGTQVTRTETVERNLNVDYNNEGVVGIEFLEFDKSELFKLVQSISPDSNAGVKYERVLYWYDKESCKLVNKQPLPKADLNNLRELFSSGEGDPLLFNCYSVETPEQISYIQQLTSITLDTATYDYSLEVDAE